MAFWPNWLCGYGLVQGFTKVCCQFIKVYAYLHRLSQVSLDLHNAISAAKSETGGDHSYNRAGIQVLEIKLILSTSFFVALVS